MGEVVTLHLYDVGSMSTVRTANDMGSIVGIGALHAGVEVYGLEVSFAYHEFGGSGIISFSPKAALGHTFRESVVMGATALSRAQLAQLLRELQPQWPAAEYDLLRRNCCTFADALCVAIGVGHIPERVNRLACAGATLMDGVGVARTHALVAFTASRALANSAAESLNLENSARRSLLTGLHFAAVGASALGGVLNAVADALSERGGPARPLADGAETARAGGREGHARAHDAGGRAHTRWTT
ncbi:hypothetical protein KFE25_005632 [Diacronema lutheri]|uniref:PPPDE domain-containing protein n=1 Tax=Diacronema lutheri TaxID=2081491 RepID=A0A8J5XKD5_DIALT|nr:hypothetical protein KFE25_005632 [Diacronema lutheri]